jgi:hypothetical protein
VQRKWNGSERYQTTINESEAELRPESEVDRQCDRKIRTVKEMRARVIVYEIDRWSSWQRIQSPIDSNERLHVQISNRPT